MGLGLMKKNCRASVARNVRGGLEPGTRTGSGLAPSIHHLEKGLLSRVRQRRLRALGRKGEEAGGGLVERFTEAHAIDWREPRSGKFHFIHTCASPRLARRRFQSESTIHSGASRYLHQEAAVLGANPEIREAPHPAASAANAAKLASRPDRTCLYYDGERRLASNAPVSPNRHASKKIGYRGTHALLTNTALSVIGTLPP